MINVKIILLRLAQPKLHWAGLNPCFIPPANPPARPWKYSLAWIPHWTQEQSCYRVSQKKRSLSDIYIVHFIDFNHGNMILYNIKYIHLIVFPLIISSLLKFHLMTFPKNEFLLMKMRDLRNPKEGVFFETPCRPHRPIRHMPGCKVKITSEGQIRGLPGWQAWM